MVGYSLVTGFNDDDASSSDVDVVSIVGFKFVPGTEETPMNVFVYHKEDHEGIFLADVIGRVDNQQTFRFLPISSPESFTRLHSFLKTHNLSTGLVMLPFMVMMHDLTGRAVHGHKIIFGEAFHRWLQNVIQQVLVERPPDGFDRSPRCPQPQTYLMAFQQSLFQHLSPTTVQLARLCLCATPPVEPVERDPPLNPHRPLCRQPHATGCPDIASPQATHPIPDHPRL